MKLVVNYDLPDKTREAKTGFSLRKFSRAVGTCMTLASPFWVIDATVGEVHPLGIARRMSLPFLYYCALFLYIQKSRKSFTKERSLEELRALSYKLKGIFVDTDPELLQQVVPYKTNYSVNFEKTLPRIE